MAMEIEIARNMIYKPAWLKNNNKLIRKEAAYAKLFASEMAVRASNQAIQINGGNRCMKAYQVERYFTDAKLMEIGEGTSEIQRIIISRQLLT